MRVPRLARLASRIFVDADLNGRFAVEMFVFVFMLVAGAALLCLYNFLAGIILLPRRWRDSSAKRIRLAVRERNVARNDGREIEYPPPLVDVLSDIHLFDILRQRRLRAELRVPAGIHDGGGGCSSAQGSFRRWRCFCRMAHAAGQFTALTPPCERFPLRLPGRCAPRVG